MFGVGTQEILVLLLVVLILFGGKRLPEIARSVGKGMGDFRRAVRDVQREIDIETLKTTAPPERDPRPREQMDQEGSRPVADSGQKEPARKADPSGEDREPKP